MFVFVELDQNSRGEIHKHKFQNHVEQWTEYSYLFIYY